MLPLALLCLGFALALALAAAALRRHARSMTAKISLRCGLTAGEVARLVLDQAQLKYLELGLAKGWGAGLSIRARRLTLRPEVASSRSLWAVAEALHEAGHALQAAEGKTGILSRLALRRWLRAAPLLLGAVAVFFAWRFGTWQLALLLFSGTWLLAQLANLGALGLELEASARARRLAVQTGLVRGEDELKRLIWAGAAAAMAEFDGFVPRRRAPEARQIERGGR